jgi:hypothetical protein
MSMPVAWVVYPLVLLALCGGLGLLVDLLCGRRLPGALVPPAGLAAIVVVGELTTLSDATAELTVPVLAFLAVLGAGFSLPWRFGRPRPWPIAAALAVFAVFAAPVVLSGEPAFAGYIKLDDTATWLALTDRVMEHGRSLAGLEPSSYRATLEFNLAAGYPVGAFLPFGAAQKLVGGDLAWVFQPYLAFLAAMLSLVLWEMAGAVVRRPPLRALVAFIAAQPALLYGYAMWGGVKEVAGALFVALAAASAPLVVRSSAASGFGHTGVWSKPEAQSSGALRPGSRGAVLPLALTAGALVGVLSVGGLVWLAPVLTATAVIGVRRLGVRRALTRAAGFVLLAGLFALPIAIGGSFSPFQPALTSEREMGNLIRPLDAVQALGIWPAGDFRVHPDATVVAAVLVALAILAALLGLWAAWRSRGLALLFLATTVAASTVVVAVASPWVGGKALATVSPALLALAVVGAVAALAIDRPTGVTLLAVVTGGVLWSNALAYGGVDLAPYGQLAELQRIGQRFAGQGPALMTEYNPYGARHFLRTLDGEGASELRVRQVPLRGGGAAEKGASVDTDQLDIPALLEYRTLVLRRSPVRSRPPLPYRLTWSGRYYEVWQRPVGFAGPAPEHLPLGNRADPVGMPSCGEIVGLGELALLHHLSDVRLVAARHAPAFDATSGALRLPRAGRYVAWLEGSVRGEVELHVDGRQVGAARQQLENDGGFVELGETRLGAGEHRVQLRFGGADLHPGSGGFPRPETGPLLFAPAGDEAGGLVSVGVDQSRRLCGRRWDWIEAVGRY